MNFLKIYLFGLLVLSSTSLVLGSMAVQDVGRRMWWQVGKQLGKQWVQLAQQRAKLVKLAIAAQQEQYPLSKQFLKSYQVADKSKKGEEYTKKAQKIQKSKLSWSEWVQSLVPQSFMRIAKKYNIVRSSVE